MQKKSSLRDSRTPKIEIKMRELNKKSRRKYASARPLCLVASLLGRFTPPHKAQGNGSLCQATNSLPSSPAFSSDHFPIPMLTKILIVQLEDY
jgi:hypothetical protein